MAALFLTIKPEISRKTSFASDRTTSPHRHIIKFDANSTPASALHHLPSDSIPSRGIFDSTRPQADRFPSRCSFELSRPQPDSFPSRRSFESSRPQPSDPKPAPSQFVASSSSPSSSQSPSRLSPTSPRRTLPRLLSNPLPKGPDVTPYNVSDIPLRSRLSMIQEHRKDVEPPPKRGSHSFLSTRRDTSPKMQSDYKIFRDPSPPSHKHDPLPSQPSPPPTPYTVLMKNARRLDDTLRTRTILDSDYTWLDGTSSEVGRRFMIVGTDKSIHFAQRFRLFFDRAYQSGVVKDYTARSLVMDAVPPQKIPTAKRSMPSVPSFPSIPSVTPMERDVKPRKMEYDKILEAPSEEEPRKKPTGLRSFFPFTSSKNRSGYSELHSEESDPFFSFVADEEVVEEGESDDEPESPPLPKK